MNTDVMLAPAMMAPTNEAALIEIVNANTAALTQIRGDLAKVDGPEKVSALMAEVDLAIQDLSMKSQKVGAALKHDQVDPRRAPGSPVPDSQYPINLPINRDNPVPWPPGYVPVVSAAGVITIVNEAEKPAEPEKKPADPQPPPHQPAAQPATGGKK